jgi:hypothetical protein
VTLSAFEFRALIQITPKTLVMKKTSLFKFIMLTAVLAFVSSTSASLYTSAPTSVPSGQEYWVGSTFTGAYMTMNRGDLYLYKNGSLVDYENLWDMYSASVSTSTVDYGAQSVFYEVFYFGQYDEYDSVYVNITQ